jgi:hypothetical protein
MVLHSKPDILALISHLQTFANNSFDLKDLPISLLPLEFMPPHRT